MKFATILQLFIIYLSTNYWLNSQQNFLPFQIVFLLSQPIPVATPTGQVDSHEVVGKGYVFTKTSHMASIGAIFTSIYHTKQLKPWPNQSASRVVSYKQLSACQGNTQPFEGEPSTHGHLKSLRNKPQQKQPRQLSASVLA